MIPDAPRAELPRRPGRPNKGLAHLDRIDADPVAKARAKAILATLSGELTVAQACEALGVSTSRFEMLRTQMLEAGVRGLVPRPPGRPRSAGAADGAAVKALQGEVGRLERELALQQLALEVAGQMRQAGAAGGPGAPSAQKNSRPGKRAPGKSV